MSNPSEIKPEIKLLRDELARIIAEVKKRDGALERVEAQNAQLRVQIEQLRVQIEQLRVQIEQKDIQIEQLKGQPDKGGGRITYYENPHSPPSANSIPARQRKKASRKDPAAHKKPGQK
ncbi:MAG: hypothetical protein J4F28_05005, partial [Nitrosopumilaceae archaeon]|nr:hypothetical protein [Nitrosopumilaceae archaeon]